MDKPESCIHASPDSTRKRRSDGEVSGSKRIRTDPLPPNNPNKKRSLPCPKKVRPISRATLQHIVARSEHPNSPAKTTYATTTSQASLESSSLPAAASTKTLADVDPDADAATIRRAKNRLAQAKVRERKEQHIKSLETRLEEQTAKTRTLEAALERASSRQDTGTNHTRSDVPSTSEDTIATTPVGHGGSDPATVQNRRLIKERDAAQEAAECAESEASELQLSLEKAKHDQCYEKSRACQAISILVTTSKDMVRFVDSINPQAIPSQLRKSLVEVQSSGEHETREFKPFEQLRSIFDHETHNMEYRMATLDKVSQDLGDQLRMSKEENQTLVSHLRAQREDGHNNRTTERDKMTIREQKEMIEKIEKDLQEREVLHKQTQEQLEHCRKIHFQTVQNHQNREIIHHQTLQKLLQDHQYREGLYHQTRQQLIRDHQGQLASNQRQIQLYQQIADSNAKRAFALEQLLPYQHRGAQFFAHQWAR